MRRLLAISLLLLFSFPLVSPLFALSADSGANLPACCRRNGKHHCQMKLEQTHNLTDKPPSVTAPSQCPFYPQMVTAVRHNDAKLHKTATLYAELVGFEALMPAKRAFARISLDTAWQKRGPPLQTA